MAQHTQAEIDKHSWFHGIDFGKLQSKGRVSPQNWSLYGLMKQLERVSLRGARVLDVGTMDGLISFIAEREGAEEVIATDLYDRKTVYLAKDILGSKVQYLPNTAIDDLLPRFGIGSFDVVVMGGLLYHLLSPLRAVLIARFLLKTGGVLLLETVTCQGDQPDLRFNLASPTINEYTTFFVPTIAAVEHMMRFSLFSVLNISTAMPNGDHGYGRTSFAAKAMPLEQAVPSTTLMHEAQQRAARSMSDRILDEFSFAKLADVPAKDTPAVNVAGVPNIIDINSFATRFDLQPHRALAATA